MEFIVLSEFAVVNPITGNSTYKQIAVFYTSGSD